MTVTVPATDIPNTLLQAQVAAVQTLYTAALVAGSANAAQAPNLLAQLTGLQIALINNLMANAFGRGNGSFANGTPAYILPATVLSSLSINA